MKSLSYIVLLSLLSVVAKAQTFVCTDISIYGPDLTPQQVQKEKANKLGSKATLTFYDKSMKISTTEDGRTGFVILDKVGDNEYQIIERKKNGDVNKLVLKLNKWVEYIRSFTIEGYHNCSLKATVTYRRE